MVPIAAVLVLIVVIFSLAVVISNDGATQLSIFGAKISANTAGIYFTGAGAMLVLLLSLGLLRTGMKRMSAKRKELRTLQKAANGKAVAAKKDPTKAAADSPAKSADKEPQTTSAERQAMLDEADKLAGDDPK